VIVKLPSADRAAADQPGANGRVETNAGTR
jgi:hypothetical protein